MIRLFLRPVWTLKSRQEGRKTSDDLLGALDTMGVLVSSGAGVGTVDVCGPVLGNPYFHVCNPPPPPLLCGNIT